MRKNKMNQTTTATEDNYTMSNLQERIDTRVAAAREQIELEEIEKTTDLALSPSETVKVAVIAAGVYAGAALAVYGIGYGVATVATEVLPPAAQKVKKLFTFTKDKVKKLQQVLVEEK